MSTIGNNTDGRASNLRDAFFTKGEKEYYSKLMQNPGERKVRAKMMSKDVKVLYKKAQELMTRVEAGEFDETQMAKAEYYLAHILSAIEDLEQILILEKTPDLTL